MACAQSALAAAAWKLSAFGRDGLAGLVHQQRVRHLVLLRVSVLDVADGASVCVVMLATPSLPLAPMPAGHCTEVLAPIVSLNFGLDLDR